MAKPSNDKPKLVGNQGPPVKPEKPVVIDPLDDAYKTAAYCARTLAASLGYKFGDSEFDSSVGVAISSMLPARVLSERDELTRILVHALAGAWGAVK